MAGYHSGKVYYQIYTQVMFPIVTIISLYLSAISSKHVVDM